MLTAQHKFGGPWDTCAPEAVITAMGGRLTDLCGHPLCVYEGGPEGFTSALQPVPLERRNQLGFVATAPGAAISHGDLIRRLRATPALTQYRDAIAAPEAAAEGAGARRVVSVSLADMPCMCQADAKPS